MGGQPVVLLNPIQAGGHIVPPYRFFLAVLNGLQYANETFRLLV